jgi:hypothetical protein
MKRYSTLLIIFILFILPSGCKKARELTYFNVNQSTEFTIPQATNLPLPGNIATAPVQTSSEFDFSNDKKSTRYVDEVVTQSLRMSVIAPENQNFNFLNKIKIYISAPGLTETLVGYKDVVPENVSSFDLDMTHARVDQYLRTETYTLRVEAVTDEITTREIKIKTDMVFRVRAKVL